MTLAYLSAALSTAFRVPSATEKGDESGFMGLQNAAEANLCEWLLKSNVTWPGAFNKPKVIHSPGSTFLSFSKYAFPS